MNAPEERHRNDWERIQRAFDELRASGKSDEQIFVMVYDDLKQLGRKMIFGNAPGDSMTASRLLSDLYVRLFNKQPANFSVQSGVHFYNMIARAMRQLLMDYLRRRRAGIRSAAKTQSLDDLLAKGLDLPGEAACAWPKNKNFQEEVAAQMLHQAVLIEKLEPALHQLEKEKPRQAVVIHLRAFANMTEEETAHVLGVSSETVTKEFRKAKARLRFYLS